MKGIQTQLLNGQVQRELKLHRFAHKHKILIMSERFA